MNNVIKQIEIDLYSPTTYEIIKAQQGDNQTRIIEFVLLDKGEPYYISDNIKINLEGCRGDQSGFIKENYCNVSGNVISVVLDSDILYADGIVEAKIVMYDDDDGSILSTIPFKISVQKNPCNKEQIEKDKKSIIDNLTRKLNHLSDTVKKNMDDNIEQGQAINFLANNTYKNMLKNIAETQTKNGITFTVNSNKSITVNGTATADVTLFVGSFTPPNNNEIYRYIGTPSTGSDTTYYTEVIRHRYSGSGTSLSKDYGSGCDASYHQFYNYIDISIKIISGYTANNLIFYPMVYLPKYFTDSTYVPYNTSPYKIGDTDELHTTNKTSIVGAINEVSERTKHADVADAIMMNIHVPHGGGDIKQPVTINGLTAGAPGRYVLVGEGNGDTLSATRLDGLKVGESTKATQDEDGNVIKDTYLPQTGNASNTTASFTPASSRTNLSAGEKLSVLFGKITKWFSDLKTVAFSGSYRDLTDKPTPEDIGALPEDGKAVSAANAESLGGLSLQKSSEPYQFGTIPYIKKADGVMEVGKYIDFHVDDNSSFDYDARITAYNDIDGTGVASSGLLLGGTTKGIFKGNLDGTATKANSVRIVDNATDNVFRNVPFVHGTDTSVLVNNPKFQFNPNSGILKVPKLSITTPYGTWINAKTNAAINVSDSVTSGSYHPILRLQTSGGHVLSFGGIANTAGFYGYKSDRTANGTDWGFTWDVNTGDITHNKSITATGGFIGNLTGTASNLSYFKCTSNTNVGLNDTDCNAIGYVTGTSNILGQTDGAYYRQVYSGSWVHEIYGDYRTGQLAVRGKNNGTWQSWRKILDSSNYTTYAPTKTGSGASGTWGISITGNAATATKATQDGSGNNIASTYMKKPNLQSCDITLTTSSGSSVSLMAKECQYCEIGKVVFIHIRIGVIPVRFSSHKIKLPLDTCDDYSEFKVNSNYNYNSYSSGTGTTTSVSVSGSAYIKNNYLYLTSANSTQAAEITGWYFAK